MAALTSGKIVLAYMESAIETFESQQTLLPKVKLVPNAKSADLQNAGNTLWRRVRQHGVSQTGFDLTGQEQGIISQFYPAYLGVPEGNLLSLRVDDMRDLSYVRDQAQIDGEKRASVLNKAIVDAIRNTGSMAYRSNATSGFDFISQAQAAMNKRQGRSVDRYFALTDTQNNKFGKELASRQTLQPNNQPDKTFQDGTLYKNIAGFDVMTSSSISLLAGGADPATTVTANVSLAPQAGTVNTTTNVVTNYDYRDSGTIPVTASASYNVGDRVTFANGGVTVKAVGRDDKTVTDEAMTFVIIEKPNGTSVRVWPRPIAADDPALSALEKAYANINTRILNTATMNRVNIDTSTQPGLFWQKDSIEVLTGEVPMEILGQFGGMKVAKERLSNGMMFYVLYDANIANVSATWRQFIWYGVNNARPQDNGIAINY